MAKLNPFEIWKSEKHGFDVWPDLLRWAEERTPHAAIDEPDLQRMKWYGLFWRKHDRDRYMLRIRIPGCEMTAEQARAVAFVAYESGHGIVDVTTRGNVQVQGLTIERIPGVLAALERVGLTSKQTGLDNVRNVTSHPLSGLDPDELIDTRDLARAVTAVFVGDRELSDLPRKFNIALTGRADSCPSDWTQDIALLATLGPGGVGFRLLVGGTQGQNPHLGWHLPVLVAPGEVADVVRAILHVFRELGSRTDKRTQVRFRYLIERIGPEGVLVETEKRLGRTLARFAEPPPPPRSDESFIGWFPQKQPGRFAVGVAVPMGRLTWQQLEGLAILARRHGDATLRTAIDQNLLLPNVPAAARGALGHDLATLGLSFDADSLTRQTVACTGKQFCSLAVTDTKGYAFQLVEELRRRQVECFGIRIAVSGCPNACAQHHTADVGLKGVRVRRGLRVVDGFDVSLGGGITEKGTFLFSDSEAGTEKRNVPFSVGVLYKKGVPFTQLAELLEKAIGEFHDQRVDGESFSAYWRRRLAYAKPETVAEEEPPLWRCGDCGYEHLGEAPPRFCPKCAALRGRFAVGDAGNSSQLPLKDPPLDALDENLTGVASVPTWRCKPCGYEHFGDEPPGICPVCGAGKEDFALVSGGAPAPTAARAVRRDGRRVLVIGGSIAGHTAAATVRELDPAARITIATDEAHRFYNRLNLTRFLNRELEHERLFDFTEAWYTEHDVEALTESRATAIDTAGKRVTFASGLELPYDALVLCHGAAAALPGFLRPDVPGVHLLRTLADVEGILAACRAEARAVVIGGGLLGLEAAQGLRTRGAAAVTVLECAPHLMPRQLDRGAAELLAALVRDRGIDVATAVTVERLAGTDRALAVELADGRRLPADLVVVSTGIRPNVEWVSRSGIRCGRGIVVDDAMRTSAPGVFAAGDVVEWREQVVGLWMNAIEQGKVAAASVVGKPAAFGGFVPTTVLKCLGLALFAIGESALAENGAEIAVQRVTEPARRIDWKLVSRRGLPVGGILLGTNEGMAEMKRLIEATAAVERVAPAARVEGAPPP